MAQTEADLLCRAAHGDRQALAALLERYGPDVRAKLAGQIPQRWQFILSEDDVMQQTYADALRDIKRFVPQGEGSFLGWLVTLARRNLLDAIKMLEAEKRGGKRKRVEPGSQAESFVALVELLESSGTTPSRYVARKEAGRILERVIQGLPEAYRRVVQLYDLQGRPVQEVAEALGRSCGAVFMLRARAHARMREEMGSASDFLSNSS